MGVSSRQYQARWTLPADLFAPYTFLVGNAYPTLKIKCHEVVIIGTGLGVVREWVKQ